MAVYNFSIRLTAFPWESHRVGATPTSLTAFPSDSSCANLFNNSNFLLELLKNLYSAWAVKGHHSQFEIPWLLLSRLAGAGVLYSVENEIRQFPGTFRGNAEMVRLSKIGNGSNENA